MVAPLLFMLTFGLIEFGRLTMVKHATIEASRVGARVASLPSATTNSVRAAVNEQLAALGMPAGTITISPSNPATAVGGQAVSVTVSVSAAQTSWVPMMRYFTGSQLTTRTTMRRESTY
jgi:Flp pilus assembly protein TadG